jgi:putative FmdB family regulatory protein
VPIYEYQCKACGHVFEREHAIGEKKKYKCPDCSCSQTQKLISQVGVVFKGTGFYITDNRKGEGSSPTRSSSKKKKGETSTPVCDIPSTVSEN